MLSFCQEKFKEKIKIQNKNLKNEAFEGVFSLFDFNCGCDCGWFSYFDGDNLIDYFN